MWNHYLVGRTVEGKKPKMFAATYRPGPQYQTYNGQELLLLKCEPFPSELPQTQ